MNFDYIDQSQLKFMSVITKMHLGVVGDFLQKSGTSTCKVLIPP